MNSGIKRVLQPIRDLRQAFADRRLEKHTVRFMERFFRESYPASGSGEVGFLIEPWPPFTALPSFVIALALAFVMRGRKVRFIWDDTFLDPDDSGSELRLQRRIGRLLARLPASVPYVRISEFAPREMSLMPDDELKHLAELNTFRHFFSETPPAESGTYRNSILDSLRTASGRVEALFRHHAFHYVIATGGIYRRSGLFVGIGRRLGVRVGSFDAGAKVLLLSTAGVAAYLDDIPRAFAAIPPGEEWIVDEAKKEMQRRMDGTDAFASQCIAAGGRIDHCGFLMPLNQSFDTSALGRHNVFASQTEWMLETVGWILASTTETVTIRRHPVERVKGMKSRDDYKGALDARFGSSNRIRYVGAEALQNTYDLLHGASVVLTHVSTLGIEAAALGKPVITQSQSCYADLGFVWGAKTREEYFSLLERATAGELRVSETQSKAAWRCFFLTECCNFLSTNFTPGQIVNLMDSNPLDILGGGDVDKLFQAFEENQPLSLSAYLLKREQHYRNESIHS